MEERRERHRERVNVSKKIIEYKIDDMVMDRVQVKSSSTTGVVRKLAIEARGPFRITTDHGNGSYSVKPFDKPDAPSKKFMAQDIYMLYHRRYYHAMI